MRQIELWSPFVHNTTGSHDTSEIASKLQTKEFWKPWNILSKDFEQKLLNEMFKHGRFTNISINKIRCVEHVLALFLVVVMDFFVALGAIVLRFSSFKGSGLHL